MQQGGKHQVGKMPFHKCMDTQPQASGRKSVSDPIHRLNIEHPKSKPQNGNIK